MPTIIFTLLSLLEANQGSDNPDNDNGNEMYDEEWK